MLQLTRLTTETHKDLLPYYWTAVFVISVLQSKFPSIPGQCFKGLWSKYVVLEQLPTLPITIVTDYPHGSCTYSTSRYTQVIVSWNKSLVHPKALQNFGTSSHLLEIGYYTPGRLQKILQNKVRNLPWKKKNGKW